METYTKLYILGGLAFLLSILAKKGWFPFHNRDEMTLELIHELAFGFFICSYGTAFLSMVGSWLKELI